VKVVAVIQDADDARGKPVKGRRRGSTPSIVARGTFELREALARRWPPPSRGRAASDKPRVTADPADGEGPADPMTG
jgi:hypothetical protein